MNNQEMLRVDGRIGALTQLILEHQGEPFLVAREKEEKLKRIALGGSGMRSRSTEIEIGFLDGVLEEGDETISIPMETKYVGVIRPVYDIDEAAETSPSIEKEHLKLLEDTGDLFLNDGYLHLSQIFLRSVQFRVGKEDIKAYLKNQGVSEHNYKEFFEKLGI